MSERRRQGFESRRPVQDGAAGKAGAERAATGDCAAMKQVFDDLQVSRRGDCRGGFRFRRSGASSVARCKRGRARSPFPHLLSRSSPRRRRAPAPLGLNGDVGRRRRSDALSLDALVANEAGEETGDAEQECLANAVYFEARGEPIHGQLAVAEVVMNRAASGRFPTSLCGVVAQPAQFSFVRRGRMPRADRASEAWRRAVGVARVAAEGMAPRLLPVSCLWYHANYVSPSWGRRLAQNTQIGLHIFYARLSPTGLACPRAGLHLTIYPPCRERGRTA